MNQQNQFETWEDICKALNIDPVASLSFADQLPDEDKAPVTAFFKLSKLSKACYGDKAPDWQNANEYKYFPYFDMDDSDDSTGFGLGYVYTSYWGANTISGSRLCFPTREMAEYAGRNFIAWYRDLMVLPKAVSNEKS